MYYFDIHCHILNGIDDGARNPEVTAQMLKMAYDDGIRGIICTPHYQPGTFDTGKAERVVRVKHLREIAQRFFPDLRIYEGCECFSASGSIVEDIDRGDKRSPAHAPAEFCSLPAVSRGQCLPESAASAGNTAGWSSLPSVSP